MENAADQISIGLLEEQDCRSANEVWLPNFTDPQRDFSWRVLKSNRFLVACAVTHLLACWIFSVPVDTCSQLITLVASVSIQALYVVLVFYVYHCPWDSCYLYSHWSQPHRRFIVARDESQGRRVVGTVAIEHHSKDPSVTELFRFRVLPEYHRRGIGGRLNREAERLAKEDFGCRTMMLDTIPEHVTGIAFYVRNGYKLTRSFIIPSPYQDPSFVSVSYEKVLE